MTISKAELNNKKVLVRVDFNVPMEDGFVQDTARIYNALDTIRYLQEANAKIILMSHLGKTAFPNEEQSLKQLIPHIESACGARVVFINDCLSENAEDIISNSAPGEIILLENLRFYAEEEKCDTEFARRLAGIADFYVNEAFSVSHRKHASIAAIPQFLPHAFGLSFLKEIETVDNFFSDPVGPKMCIIGGSKISTKVKLLKNLVKKVDKLALGGGIAGAFLAFCGNQLLRFFDPKEYADEVMNIMNSAKEHNCELIMPTDFSALINSGNSDFDQHAIISSDDKDGSASIFDIGPNSVELFKSHIATSKVVMWNGPVGLFEKMPFDFGTRSLAEYIAEQSRKNKLISIVGGGDTGFAMKKFNCAQDISYISTAGGAFLTYLEGDELAAMSAMSQTARKLI